MLLCEISEYMAFLQLITIFVTSAKEIYGSSGV